MRSDFSVFHRIDRIESMDGPTLCKFAWRVSAYGGVVRARIEAEQQRLAKTADGRPREWVSNEEAMKRADDGIFERVS